MCAECVRGCSGRRLLGSLGWDGHTLGLQVSPSQGLSPVLAGGLVYWLEVGKSPSVCG